MSCFYRAMVFRAADDLLRNSILGDVRGRLGPDADPQILVAAELTATAMRKEPGIYPDLKKNWIEGTFQHLGEVSKALRRAIQACKNKDRGTHRVHGDRVTPGQLADDIEALIESEDAIVDCLETRCIDAWLNSIQDIAPITANWYRYHMEERRPLNGKKPLKVTQKNYARSIGQPAPWVCRELKIEGLLLKRKGLDFQSYVIEHFGL